MRKNNLKELGQLMVKIANNPKTRKRLRRFVSKLTKRQRRADQKMADVLAVAIIPTLYKLLQAYPIGSRKHQVCLDVLTLMTHTWPHREPLVPMAIRDLAASAKQ